MSKALIVGINDYPGNELKCCVNDCLLYTSQNARSRSGRSRSPAPAGARLRARGAHQMCIRDRAGVISDGGQTACLADGFSLAEGVLGKGGAGLLRLDGDAQLFLADHLMSCLLYTSRCV